MTNHKPDRNKSFFMLILAMFIYGTIGILRRYIPLSSGLLAFARGMIGSAFLLLFVLLRRQKLNFSASRKKLVLLIFSGAMIGFNWIFLFEAYRYTSVAIATLCYYMAPILIILVSPLVFHEKITRKKALCVFAALIGAFCVSGVPDTGIPKPDELTGILFGLGAAVLYASAVMLNKKITGIGTYEKTILQLFSASVVLFPYLLLTEDFSALALTGPSVLMLLIVGIVHTGIAYALYFGSVEALNAQTVALFSYIDPITAILLSAVILRERMTLWGILGTVLILGSAVYSELDSENTQQ